MSTAARLRLWQHQALAAYEESNPNDFLVTATPGAGKTTFALTLALRLKERRSVNRIIVVAPTDHLRTQWADAASGAGLVLDPTLKNNAGPVRPGTDGYVTTYAQVAGHPMLHRARTQNARTLVILDEIHHAADGLSWGDAVSEAFAPAQRRLSLTGTPFRTKADERIPYVRYEETDDELVSLADYTYGYREALRDGVVRPVVFAAYSGTSRWMNSAGEVLEASLSDAATKAAEDAAWRTALDPSGEWIPHVIAAADARLSDIRASGSPDAGALMLATDQETARAYAKLVKKVTGRPAVLVLSDDPRSSKKIEAFRQGTDPWLVAVKQVSEGVDIARLGVCVWACSFRTPLFFAQAVGRVVRARSAQESATVFLPAVRPLLALAASLEEERNQVVRVSSGEQLDDVERLETEPGAGITMLGAEAEFAHVLHAGRAIVADRTPISEEDQEFLGLPGLLTPEQTAVLLASRDAELRKARPISLFDEMDQALEPDSWRDVDSLRKEVHELVGRLAGRSGRPHAQVHVEVRRAVPGPSSAEAPWDTLMARRDWLLARVG
ncbi:MAG: DEAD/DEAH box helicase [Actinomycetales bacterium]|nr:DEAD/DEAH box helicase [Actinomycetales bacterium]